MDKATFAECLSPALKYYGKPLGDEALGVYYRELGGFTENQINEAIRTHMANSRYWPKVPDLRKLITGQDVVIPRRQSLSDNKDLARHVYAAERMLEARLDSNKPAPQIEGSFRLHLKGIVDRALDDYRHRRDVDFTYPPGTYLNENSARSVAYSTIYRAVMRGLEA